MIANLYTSRADIYHKYARVNGMKTRWGEQRNQMTENNEQVFTSHASVCAFSVVVLCECVFGYFFFSATALRRAKTSRVKLLSDGRRRGGVGDQFHPNGDIYKCI